MLCALQLKTKIQKKKKNQSRCERCDCGEKHSTKMNLNYFWLSCRDCVKFCVLNWMSWLPYLLFRDKLNCLVCLYACLPLAHHNCIRPTSARILNVIKIGHRCFMDAYHWHHKLQSCVHTDIVAPTAPVPLGKICGSAVHRSFCHFCTWHIQPLLLSISFCPISCCSVHMPTWIV